jgi:hypothetical protein
MRNKPKFLFMIFIFALFSCVDSSTSAGIYPSFSYSEKINAIKLNLTSIDRHLKILLNSPTHNGVLRPVEQLNSLNNRLSIINESLDHLSNEFSSSPAINKKATIRFLRAIHRYANSIYLNISDYIDFNLESRTGLPKSDLLVSLMLVRSNALSISTTVNSLISADIS